MNMYRNPTSNLALNVDELQPDMRYTVINGEDYLETGTILQIPTYGDEGWFGGLARIDGDEAPTVFDVYDKGISCSPDGSWSDTYTVAN